MESRASTGTKASGEAFVVAGWRVDPAALSISKDRETRRLEPRAMAVLDYLACRQGAVVTRQELEGALWTGMVVGYDALSNTIIKLRKAFGDKARAPSVIETIPKTGYRLIAEVTLLEDGGGAGGSRAGQSGRMPRKLAAILYADVAGYSRLTHEDEDETHRMLKQYLDLFAERVDINNGRVMHYAGDAILAMFDAAVDAINCARAVQQEIYDRNETLPAGKGLRFRIGINSGDVFEDRGDVYGDGVNIAARLEGLAPAGGICVSESVRSAVGRGAGIGFQFVGEHQVKNIDEPVRVYHLETAAARLEQVMQPPRPIPEKPSVAVLPFDNMSGDQEQEYFSDGLSEDITTDLSKLSGLLVIARNSAFAYRDKPVDLTRVSRDLGVRYVLEGSVRKSGQRVRINAQLIDCNSGMHVWAERFDRDLDDIFSVQDEVTREIVGAISPSLLGSEASRFEQRETENFEAYDYFLKGREQALLDTEESTREAQRLLRKAIDLDPDFASAFSLLARSTAVEFINNWNDPAADALEKSLQMAQKAVDLNPGNPHAHFTIGTIAFWLKDHRRALDEVNQALKLDPNFSEAYAGLSMIQIYTGDPARALETLQTAMRLDPHYRDIYLHFAGQAYFHLARYDEAEAVLKRRLIRKPASDVSRVLLAACYGHLGQFDRSRAEWEEALRVNPQYSIEQKRTVLPYSNPDDFEQFVDGLRKAGIDVA